MASHENLFPNPFNLIEKRRSAKSFLPQWLRVVNFLKQKDFRVNDEMIEKLKNCVWHPEIQFDEKLGVAIASAFYGEEWSGTKEIYQKTVNFARKIGWKGGVTNISETSGFNSLTKMPSGLEPKQCLKIQAEVAKSLVPPALGKIGIKTKEIDLFLIATSVPISPNQHLEIAAALGIPPEVVVVRFWEACNSSGRARAHVEAGKFDNEIKSSQRRRGISTLDQNNSANILLFAVDDGERLIDVRKNSSQDYSTKDPGGPLQLFATAASAMVWKHGPKGTFRQLGLTDWSEKRGMEYLQFKQSYKNWDLTKEKYLFIVQHATSPGGNRIVDMHPKIGVVFKNLVIKLIIETLEKTAEKHKEIFAGPKDLQEKIKKVIIHHPSKTIFDGVSKGLAKQGYDFSDEQLQWVITEGNSPATTMPIAFGRQMKDLNPGDLIMFVTFGAGGEMTCTVEEIGLKQ